MSVHGSSYAKWYCAGCSPLKELNHSDACAACCGFRNVSDIFQARLVRVLDDLDNNPLTAIMADEIPELAAAINHLTAYANGTKP